MAYQSKPLYFINPAFVVEEMQQVISEYNREWLGNHEFGDVKQLFHYTSLEGLKGILEERGLRCGHASNLNDPQDFVYGKSIVSDALQEKIISENREDVRAFLSDILVEVNAFHKYFSHTFVACFCDSANLLSQWRMYADRGGGYCMGFKFNSDTRFISELSSTDGAKYLHLRKIIYDKKLQKKFIAEYLEKVVPVAETKLQSLEGNVAPITIMQHVSVMAVHAANLLMDMTISFKHPAFKEEKEWRLIRVTRDDDEPNLLDFIMKSGQLHPFRLTHIFNIADDGKPTFPLVYIGYGPKHDPVQTQPALELFSRYQSSLEHLIKLNPNIDVKGVGYRVR